MKLLPTTRILDMQQFRLIANTDLFTNFSRLNGKKKSNTISREFASSNVVKRLKDAKSKFMFLGFTIGKWDIEKRTMYFKCPVHGKFDSMYTYRGFMSDRKCSSDLCLKCRADKNALGEVNNNKKEGLTDSSRT